jgi:ATP-dependent helicase HrpA
MLEFHYPPELPITDRREDLLATIGAHQVVVVAGETGSGKSTQLPKLCLELGRGDPAAAGGAKLIGHTQPRRIAARAVAERVAEELGTEVGKGVGFAVRFTDRTGPDTRIKVMTDGILLAEIQRDRTLSAYDTIIIDEAHERSLNIDFLLGYLTQLLPRRPDLKVVITSATIDTARFAEHFSTALGCDVPIIEVSGRTYPVELRYRPIGLNLDGSPAEGDDRDQVAAITDAVQELAKEGPGDVLVFLSGEREIRDTAEALERVGLPGTDVLPLYARLSAAEQHRVFAPHRGRRIVLATNVAETSLTVPGIRYVVDPGTARISRFNRRTKVQRLPIEPISQASADQRAGRCGRVAPGICIRLYAEDDLLARPEFTEPEILRTNLASVVLQMAAARLGHVESFPFVEPPDARSIGDGIALLEELGALERKRTKDGHLRLTDIGRRLARLPVDPRLGRMVLEADRNGCVREVLVIAAALSIMDPRERPTDSNQQRAAELHARFADPSSDFLAYVNLWSYLREIRKELSSSAFRRRVKAEHLHFLRIREWEDVHSQLRQIAGGLGIHANVAGSPTNASGRRQEPDPDAIHRSLLAGLLSHIGVYDPEKREYLGARQARFTIGRGSALGKATPRWVVAGELVETDRLRARTVARVQPEWIERAAGDVAKRTYGTAWWDEEREASMTDERVSVFGLEVAKRRIPVGRVDVALARELFIHHALVLGEWRGGERHPFVDGNVATAEAVRALEAKARRQDVLVGDDRVYDLYDARLPDDITSGRHFDRWWRDDRQSTPHLLDLTMEELIDPGAGLVSPDDFPDTWTTAGGLVLPLSYRFEPGHALDGVTVDVPLDVLAGFDGAHLDWQVPGHREALVTALVRSLPKQLRRAFVPVPDHVTAFLAEHEPADGPLLDLLARALTQGAGERVAASAFDPSLIEQHLLVNFRAVDDRGRPLAWSKDLPALQAKLAPRIREAVAALFGGSGESSIAVSGLTAWTIGELPATVDSLVGGRVVTAHPALVDEGEAVGVRAFASPTEAAAAMRAGTRRLLLLQLGPQRSALRKAVPEPVALQLAGGTIGSVAHVVDDVLTATVDHLVGLHGGPPRDGAAFDALLLAVRQDLVATALDALVVVARIVTKAADVAARLDRLDTVAALGPAVDDMRTQLRALVHLGFVTEATLDRLRDVERYVMGVARRAEKVTEDPTRDRRSMALVQQLEDDWAEVAGADVGAKVRWQLEELRVNLFAQALGAKGGASEAKVRKAIALLR